MRYALPILFLATGCATAPAASPAPAPPQPPVAKPEHKKCSGPTSEVAIRRVSEATVEMAPGERTVLVWNLKVICGAILYEGAMLTLVTPDGTVSSEALPETDRMVFMTGQSVNMHVDFTMFPASEPGKYVIQAVPVWIDSYTIKRYRGAVDLERSSIQIQVSNPDPI